MQSAEGILTTPGRGVVATLMRTIRRIVGGHAESDGIALFTPSTMARVLVIGGALAALLAGFIPFGSTGPTAALGVGLAVWLVATGTRNPWRLAGAAVGLAMGGAVLWWAASSGQLDSVVGWQRITGRLGDAGAVVDLGRAERWRQAWDMVQNQTYGAAWPGAFSDASFMEADYPHNLILEVLAELGAVGLLLVAGIVAAGLRGAFSHPVVLALWAYAAANAMVSGDVAGNGAFWLMATVGHAMSKATQLTPANRVGKVRHGHLQLPQRHRQARRVGEIAAESGSGQAERETASA